MKSSSSSAGGGALLVYYTLISYLAWFFNYAAFFLRYYYYCFALYIVAPPNKSSFGTLFDITVLLSRTFEEIRLYYSALFFLFCFYFNSLFSSFFL